MSKPQIICISTAIPDPHVERRMRDFSQYGYEVVLYGFSRDKGMTGFCSSFKLNIIGNIKAKTPYFLRIIPMFMALAKVFFKYRKQPVVYYFYGYAIALFSFLVLKKPYIYEEADLSYTYLSNSFIVKCFSLIDRLIIKRSILTIVTSYGFLKYHQFKSTPCNVCLIPNKLDAKILDSPQVTSKKMDIKHLSIGFAGGVRFHSLLSFAEIISRNFPQHSIYFYGPVSNLPSAQDVELLQILEKRDNVFFKGPFQSPKDLFGIYSTIDLVLCTYDACYANVKYAEPNKLYESIYFRKPILVTKDVYLADRVEQLGIGYAVDPLNEIELVSWMKNLTEKDILQKIQKCATYQSEFCLNDFSEAIEMFEKRLKQ